jgi:uncharacterized membrane protein HdeD (DUF308 family)
MLRSFTIAEGVLLVVLGVLALLSPVIASFAVTILVGVAFLVGGIIGWINNLTRRRQLQPWLVVARLVVSTLFLLAGASMLQSFAGGGLPLLAQVAALSLAIGVVFLVEGLVAIVTAISHRQISGWIWGLINGLATLVLGLLILNMQPAALLPVLGILVGVSFVFSGVDLIVFGSRLHPSIDVSSLRGEGRPGGLG